MSLYGACQEPARNERKGCPTSCHSALRRRSRTWRQSHAAISRGVYRGNPTRQGPRSDRLAAMRDSTPAPGSVGKQKNKPVPKGHKPAASSEEGTRRPANAPCSSRSLPHRLLPPLARRAWTLKHGGSGSLCQPLLTTLTSTSVGATSCPGKSLHRTPTSGA